MVVDTSNCLNHGNLIESKCFEKDNFEICPNYKFMSFIYTFSSNRSPSTKLKVRFAVNTNENKNGCDIHKSRFHHVNFQNHV